MKSYNKSALRGEKYDDKDWQADMHAAGVFIPDDLLYTPDGPMYAMQKIREQNVNSFMKHDGLNEKEAQMKADDMYKTAMSSYKGLLR